MQHLKTPMWLRYVVAVLTLVISINVNAQVQTARHVSMIPNSGGYYEYLPQGYSASGSQAYPLIIFIHGVGELGDGSPWSLPRLLGLGLPKVINDGQFPVSHTVNGQSFKFIVLSPQFIGWPSPPDIDQIINYALANYKVDANRIYLTGLSMGGGTIWEYAGTNPLYANRVAAMVPVCGASWPDFGRARTIAAANLAIWATHNSGDPTVPVHYTNDYVNYMNQSPFPNPLAKKTIWNIADHDAWTATYNPNFREDNKNVYEWMLQYYRGSGGPGNLAPVVNAGADQVVNVSSNSVQLGGTVSDPDGSVASYSWSKISGPTQFSISNSNILNPVLSNLTSGKYVFRLSATDNKGATSSDDVDIVVSTSIPARVEAEGFSAQFGVSVETTTDAGGGQSLGYIGNGDWMEYAINATQAGTFNIALRLASAQSGGQLQVRNAAGTVLATVTVPNTGGWQTWQTVTTTVTLPQGNQTIRLVSTATAGWNINWLDFTTATTPPPTPPPTYVNLPSKIEAENYSAHFGTVTESTTDAGGGQSLGYIGNGDWMEYQVSAASSGSYTLQLRVASAENGGQLQVRNAAGTVLATVTVPNTGGWQTWQTISASLTLPQGNQTIRLVSTAAAGWNINWLNFTQSVAAPPASTKIEAESYTTMSGVQVENTSDAGGGQNVGYIDPTDWMQYNYNAPQAGSYTISFRVATPQSGAQLQVYSSGSTLLATVAVPNTGGWQVWQTVTTTVTLAQGNQPIYIVCSAQNWNFNWMEITPSSSGSRTASGGSSTELLQQEADLEIFPNPVEDRFALKVTNPYQGEMKVILTDMQGATVKTFTLQKGADGTTQHYLSIGSLPKGQYIIQVSIKDWSKTEQLIKL